MPLSLISILGYYDDQKEIDYKLKLVAQILIAKILIDQGFLINNLNGFLGFEQLPNLFSQFLTMLIFLTIINSFNFIDGIDGLAISIISVFIISFEFFANSQTEFQTISIILLASFIPLLYFNYRSMNKIFLVDSGSLFLGGIVSIYVLNILSSDYIIKNEYDINKMIFVISILGYPIIDIIRVFFLRILNGTSPFVADRNHIHHRLLDKFKSHLLTSLFIVSMSVLLTIFAQILF